jgi:hypothetical protein
LKFIDQNAATRQRHRARPHRVFDIVVFAVRIAFAVTAVAATKIFGLSPLTNFLILKFLLQDGFSGYAPT